MNDVRKDNRPRDDFNFDLKFEGTVVATPVAGKIEISGLPVARVVAKELVSVLESVTMRDLPESLDVDRIEEAFVGLLVIRVNQSRYKRVGDDPRIHYKSVRYPAFLRPVLRPVGRVESVEDGVNFEVVLSAALERFTKKDYNWDKIAETLQALDVYGTPCGLEMAQGMPKAVDGLLDVMSFMVQDGNVVSHDGGRSPEQAFCFAAVGYAFSTYVWGVPRWQYNSMEFYHRQTGALVRNAFKTLGRA